MSAELELRWELLELQLEIAGWKWAEVSRWGSGYWKVSVSELMVVEELMLVEVSKSAVLVSMSA